jgi:hypothetical protein
LNLVMRVLENFDLQMEQQMLTSADFAYWLKLRELQI